MIILVLRPLVGKSWVGLRLSNAACSKGISESFLQLEGLSSQASELQEASLPGGATRANEPRKYRCELQTSLPSAGQKENCSTEC